MEPKGYELL